MLKCMKAGIEIYISIVLITIMAVLCASFIVADIKAADARDAYYGYYEQIDNSNCAASVVKACIADAEESGYGLTVVEVGHESQPMYKLTFKYRYGLTILGVSKEHTIVGYVQE